MLMQGGELIVGTRAAGGYQVQKSLRLQNAARGGHRPKAVWHLSLLQRRPG